MNEKISQEYAILLEPGVAFEPARVAQAMAPALDAVAMDLARQLRERPGIVAEHLTEKQVGLAAMALQQDGARFFIVRQDALVTPPNPVTVEQGRVLKRGYRFATPSGEAAAPWDQILFMDCSRVRFQEMKEHTELKRDIVVGPRGGVATHWRQERKKRPQSAWREVLDIICYRPWLRLRLDSSSYRFATDGLPVHPSRHENFAARVVVFKSRSAKASVGPGVEALLDGNPVTNLRSQSMAAYENHIRWQLQLLYRRDTSSN